MNYFAHARRFLDDPYMVAGTAVPDWLNVVDRRVRTRSKSAAPLVHDADPYLAAVARGVVQHHHDDAWFHQTAIFTRLNLHFTVEIRDRLEHEAGLRPSFLGHILVELLLDAELIHDEPVYSHTTSICSLFSALRALAEPVMLLRSHCIGTPPRVRNCPKT